MAALAYPRSLRAMWGKGSLVWALCIMVSIGCAAGQAAPPNDPDNNNGTRIPSAANGTPFVWCDYGESACEKLACFHCARPVCALSAPLLALGFAQCHALSFLCLIPYHLHFRHFY